jgi:hypothetical protein
VRTIIDLPREQLDALDALRRRDGISRAELIRRLVASHVQARAGGDAERAFGLWRGRRMNGLRYQNRLRREWGERTRRK